MPKFSAEASHVEAAEAFFRKHKGLGHLRGRKRADLLTIESGPAADPYSHARLRRVGVHVWTLEFGTHTGRWERTPFRGQLGELLTNLVETFGWTLTPVHGDPERTSDPEY